MNWEKSEARLDLRIKHYCLLEGPLSSSTEDQSAQAVEGKQRSASAYMHHAEYLKDMLRCDFATELILSQTQQKWVHHKSRRMFAKAFCL